MARKLHDHYFKKAKQEGYFARSVYKLEQINKRFKVLRQGDACLDLGSCPGSWVQYEREVVGERGIVAGVDIQPVKPSIRKIAFVLLKDIAACTPEDFAPAAKAFDAVLSDMAPNTTGIRFADQAMSLELCEIAFALAQKVLKPGGNMVLKIFESGEVKPFSLRIAPSFSEVAFYKPEATREESYETYIVARGFRIVKPKKDDAASQSGPTPNA